MNQLMTEQELQALASLLSRVPMTPPEQMWAQSIVQRLAAFCSQPQEEEAPDESSNPV